ncbi:MAG: DinB family protein, partial [Phycisphaerae bacterium]
ADIEESRWFEMPAPGVNHVAWQVGHLAASQVALIHVRCCAENAEDCLPAGFKDCFGRGSTPVSDPAAYPPIPEIRAVFDRIQNEAIRRITALPDAEWTREAGPPPSPMFTTKEGAIGTAVMHETFHAGQIALLRRFFGKAALR